MDVTSENDYRSWLILSFAKGIGLVKIIRLLNKFSNPQNIIGLNQQTLSGFGLSAESIKALHFPDDSTIQHSLDWLDEPGHHLITIDDTDYPVLLREIANAPIVLFAVGKRSVLQNIHFAIVGSRNPSNNGRKLAEDFAYRLSLSGLTICSGLALGIDFHSHFGALNANCPTIAVLGNGLKSIYPAKHKDIANKITERGLLLSEFFPEIKPKPSHFPQRNRIISGISTGVLVVEAAKKSGSLITANYALEQGREVFAIPGSIHNPLARGTHSLIRRGAKLVETIDDILEELTPLAHISVSRISDVYGNIEKHIDLAPDYKKIIESMSYDEVSVDSIVELSGLTADAVSSMLLTLELDGIVESNNTGKYRRCF